MIDNNTPPYTRVKYIGESDKGWQPENDLFNGATYLFMGIITNPEKTRYNKGKLDVVLMRNREIFTAIVKPVDLEVL